MNHTNTQVAEIDLQPNRARDYSSYVPVQLGQLTTAAFIDSGNTFANVISPQTMTVLGISICQLEPVPQLCTLHVADIPTWSHQYTPRGPTTEACSGTEAVTVSGRSHRILSL